MKIIKKDDMRKLTGGSSKYKKIISSVINKPIKSETNISL